MKGRLVNYSLERDTEQGRFTCKNRCQWARRPPASPERAAAAIRDRSDPPGPAVSRKFDSPQYGYEVTHDLEVLSDLGLYRPAYAD